MMTTLIAILLVYHLQLSGWFYVLIGGLAVINGIGEKLWWDARMTDLVNDINRLIHR